MNFHFLTPVSGDGGWGTEHKYAGRAIDKGLIPVEAINIHLPNRRQLR